MLSYSSVDLLQHLTAVFSCWPRMSSLPPPFFDVLGCVPPPHAKTWRQGMLISTTCTPHFSSRPPLGNAMQCLRVGWFYFSLYPWIKDNIWPNGTFRSRVGCAEYFLWGVRRQKDWKESKCIAVDHNIYELAPLRKILLDLSIEMSCGIPSLAITLAT